MRKTDRERRKKWVRVLAIVLAILLIAGTLVSVLPIFEAFAEDEAVNRYELAVTANLTAGTARVREKLTYTNTAGRALVARITSYASRYFFSFTRAMKSGIFTFTGQADMQGLFLQCRQRCASARAVSSS